MPVKPTTTPATPAAAATLVLLRDRAEGGVEVLLIQRHRASKFAAGDFVFPGGKIEADDNPEDADRYCVALDPDRAAAALGLPPHTAVAHWIGAIRETFEEVGVLLAYDADGRPAQLPRGSVTEYRRACQRDNRAFWEMVRAEALTLATDQLVYFAHWITPEESPLRFDTRFFAARMPAGQDAIADGHEIVAVRWLPPQDALAAAARGEISLRNPTARNIELIAGTTSAAEALARLAGREVSAIRPRVIVEHGQRRVLMPGDAGYW